jgi:hypothetical protein
LIEKFGKNITLRRPPYCPICGEVTNILKVKGSLEIKTNFAHPKDSQCPSIEENRQKYLLLPPSAKDQTNG